MELMEYEDLDYAFCIIINSETKMIEFPDVTRSNFKDVKNLVLRLVDSEIKDIKFDPIDKKYYTVSRKNISNTRVKFEYHEETILALRLMEALRKIECLEVDFTTKLSVKGKFYHDMINYLKINKSKNEEYGLILIDIDDFKKVNDYYGHDVGDVVLREVSAIITSVIRNDSLRERDLIGRFGGEEIVILLKDITEEELGLISDRIRYSIENANTKVPVTVSIGFVHSKNSRNVIPDDSPSISLQKSCDLIISMADKALRASKAAGKNISIGYKEDELQRF